MENNPFPIGDRRHQVFSVKREINDLIAHVRENLVLAEDPQTKQLFEKTVSILRDLVTTYDKFETR